MRHVFFVLAAAIFLAACPVPPQPLPVPPNAEVTGDYPALGEIVEVFADGSPQALASPCGKACVALARIPCDEGLQKNCYRGCVSMASHQRVPTTCWMLATTPADARACGGIRCLPP